MAADYLITSKCVNLVAQISTDFGRWLALLESGKSNLEDFKSQQLPIKAHASVGTDEQSQPLEGIRLDEAYKKLDEWDLHSESDLKTLTR